MFCARASSTELMSRKPVCMVLRTVLLSVSVCLLSACTPSSFNWMFKPYRIDVRQGNAVSQEMVSQLSSGMSREQVKFIMGSPLLVDIFHADRWDYAYQFSQGYSEPERRIVSVFFADNKLLRVEGNVRAADKDAVDVPIAPRVIDITSPAAKS